MNSTAITIAIIATLMGVLVGILYHDEHRMHQRYDAFMRRHPYSTATYEVYRQDRTSFASSMGQTIYLSESSVDYCAR